ncbi:hypothetical protein [Streptomyces coeruleorubidus]
MVNRPQIAIQAPDSFRARRARGPSTTDPVRAREWLERAAAGVEATEAVIGAVTGSLTAPRTLLLGRYDPADYLECIGRSTTLSRTVGHAVADHLAPPHGAHPWTGWTFSASWRTRSS